MPDFAAHPQPRHADPAHDITVGAEVAQALAEHRPVVALESTLISHGLPRPDNLRVAREIEQAVRDEGAVPATVAVVAGRLVVGLDDAQVEQIALGEDVAKVSVRDLPTAVALGRTGATTVASTAAVAARTGIAVFATGGLGGVHRGARESWDESADLVMLGRCPVTVVCAGVKSILDVPATLERLESLSVGLVGYRTDRFPGFYLRDSGQPLDWRVDSPKEVAAIMAARRGLGLDDAALIVANPLPEDEQLEPALHQRVLDEALAGLEQHGIRGKDVTPYLLDRFHTVTEGRSLQVNVRIILRNAALAAQIAVAAA